MTVNEIRKQLADGVLDDRLTELYRRTAPELGPWRERIGKAADAYLQVFGGDGQTDVGIFSAPGRTELGGNHTDHQGGKVLAAAVDLDAIAAAAPNGTDRIRVFSENFGMTEVRLSADDPESGEALAPVPAEAGTTAALIRGMAAGLKERGVPVSGFDAWVCSDVPGGSGLSSSACFEILTGTVMNHLFGGGSVLPEEIALTGRMAENVYFGKPSGLLDQMGCAMGGAVYMDFRDQGKPVCRSIVMDPDAYGYALCIIDTGGSHAGLTEFYAAIPGEMRAAAEVFGKKVLSEVQEDDFFLELKKVRAAAGDRAVQRGIHYFSECRRAEAEAEALDRRDFETFLRLVQSSGDSSFMFLQNVDTWQDPNSQPVALALAAARHYLAGRGAVRVHGGGFAGTVQAYVPLDRLSGFTKAMDELLGQGSCRRVYIRPVGGVRVAE